MVLLAVGGIEASPTDRGMMLHSLGWVTSPIQSKQNLMTLKHCLDALTVLYTSQVSPIILELTRHFTTLNNLLTYSSRFLNRRLRTIICPLSLFKVLPADKFTDMVRSGTRCPKRYGLRRAHVVKATWPMTGMPMVRTFTVFNADTISHNEGKKNYVRSAAS
jgi:hypothetical protein